MSSLNDELFALRLGLQDGLMEETEIIKELKLHLIINKNIPVDNIDQMIVDFAEPTFTHLFTRRLL